MTASFTSRWLIDSMHYKLALTNAAAHAPQDDSNASTGQRISTDNPDQRISQDIGGFINGTGTGINSGNVGIYNYTIQVIASATNLVGVLNHPVGNFQFPQRANFRFANSGLSVLGRGSLCLRSQA